MAKRLTKARKAELARFFEFVYQRALELDPRELADAEDIPRALTAIRGAARAGYYDCTGEWLTANGAPPALPDVGT
jgi:hypothetical protein